MYWSVQACHIQSSLRRLWEFKSRSGFVPAADVSTRRTSSRLCNKRAALKPTIALYVLAFALDLVNYSCGRPLKGSTRAMCSSKICTNLPRHVLNRSHFFLAFSFLVATNVAIPYSPPDTVQLASTPIASSSTIQAISNGYFLS